jgi:ureidoacrylate peracid hydrolase
MSTSRKDRIGETYLNRDNIEAKTSRWLDEIEPYNRRDVQFDLQGAALVVVDMQRFFCEPGYPLYTENSAAILPNVRQLVQHFRVRARPVIFAAQQNKGELIDRGVSLRKWWPTVPLEGSREVEIVEELAPLPSEKVIAKRRYSAFFGSDLDLTLRSTGVSQVVVAGLFTNVCVEATARDAFMNDYLVFLPADACASLNEQMHLASLRTLAHWYAKVVPISALISQQPAS